MNSTMNPGRFAGLLYVLMSIIGFVAMRYVPSKLLVRGNATATADNIPACDTPVGFAIPREQVAISATVPGHLARPCRHSLGDPELNGHTVAAISRQGG